MIVEWAVRQHLSDKLNRNTELRFGHDFDHKRPLAFPVRAVPVYVPRDLRTAISYQFVEEISEFRTWKLCLVCRMPFPVRREGQRHCSGGCRQKAYRERKNQAG